MLTQSQRMVVHIRLNFRIHQTHFVSVHLSKFAFKLNLIQLRFIPENNPDGQ